MSFKSFLFILLVDKMCVLFVTSLLIRFNFNLYFKVQQFSSLMDWLPKDFKYFLKVHTKFVNYIMLFRIFSIYIFAFNFKCVIKFLERIGATTDTSNSLNEKYPKNNKMLNNNKCLTNRLPNKPALLKN